MWCGSRSLEAIQQMDLWVFGLENINTEVDWWAYKTLTISKKLFCHAGYSVCCFNIQAFSMNLAKTQSPPQTTKSTLKISCSSSPEPFSNKCFLVSLYKGQRNRRNHLQQRQDHTKHINAALPKLLYLALTLPADLTGRGTHHNCASPDV